MRSRRVVGGMACMALILFASEAIGQAGPAKQPDLPLVDLSQLGLKVDGAQVVPELLLGTQQDVTVRPKPGYKIVVVTMTGAIKGPGRFIEWPQLFAVVYEKYDTTFGERRLTGEVVGAEHVGSEWMGRDNWVAHSETSAVKAGPVSFKFAVTLPKDVMNFKVLCATGVGGPVQLSAK